MAKPLLFLSIDIEADGPAPGLASMLNLGVVGIEAIGGNVVFEYEANLKPIPDARYNLKTNEFWNRPENLNALVYICDQPRLPADVMKELAAGITELQAKYQIETIGYPIAFDWQWINWYFIAFHGTNPLGYAGRDVGSYKWATRSSVYPVGVKMEGIELPPKYKKLPKHSGLVDAYTQGMYFWKMYNLNTTVPTN
jgi:hypothetical protein